MDEAAAAISRSPHDERDRVVLLAAYSASGVGALVLGRAAAQSLFLTTLGPEALGWRYPFSALLVLAGVYTYWRLVGVFRQDRVILAFHAAQAASLAVLGALVLRGAPGPIFVLYGVTEAMEAIALLAVVDLVRASLSGVEQRRWGAWIGLAASVATVLAGGSLVLGADQVGPAALVGLQAASAGLAGAVVATLGARYGARFAPDRSLAHPAPAFTADLRRVGRSWVPLSFAWLSILAAGSLVVSDWMLASELAARGTEARIVAFYGTFAALSTTLGVLVQVFLTRLVFERFGVLFALLVYPVALAAGLTAVVATGGDLWALTAVRMISVVFGITFGAAANLLFLTVAPDFRPRALALVRGLLAPFTALWVGVGVALVAPEPMQGGAALLAGMLAVWLVGSVSAWRAYVQRLAETLRGRPYAEEGRRHAARDDGMRVALDVAFRDPNASHVVQALDLVEALGREGAPEGLVGLLAHPSEIVRLRAARALGRSGRRQHGSALRERLDDPHPEVRAAAIEALAELEGAASVAAIQARVGDPDAGVRGAAVLALVEHGGPQGLRLGAEAVRQMVGAQAPRLRAVGTRVLGAFYGPPLRETLVMLLGDPAPEVRAAALEVAGQSGDHALLPKLVVGLQDRRTASAAALALQRFGHGVERDIGFAIADGRRPVPTRAALARILARMGTPLAAEVLASHASLEPEALRTAIHAALARIAAQARPDARILDLRLAEELAAAEEIAAMARDLAVVGGATLLDDALRARFERAVHRVFLLLQARHPRYGAALDRVYTTWRAGADEPQRLRATELLGNVLSGAVRDRTAALITSSPAPSGAAREPSARLEALLRGPDEWLVVCALHAIGEARLEPLTAVIEDVLLDEVPEIVRDAARDALARVAGAEPPPPGARRMYTTVEKVLYLKKVALFARLPAEELVGISSIAKPAWFDAGAVVFERGDTGDALYLVVFGEAQVSAGDREIARLGPGEVFGEMALLDAEPRMATVRASGDLATLRIGREEFVDLVDERPDVLKGIVQVLSGRLRARAP